MVIKVVFRQENEKINVRFEEQKSFSPSFGSVYEVPVIPSNYGLITWDGSALTVS